MKVNLDLPVEEIDPSDLEGEETISEGQAHDLKIEKTVGGVTFRYWLSRCGRSDGETHAVDVEACIGGRWQTVHRYGTPGW